MLYFVSVVRLGRGGFWLAMMGTSVAVVVAVVVSMIVAVVVSMAVVVLLMQRTIGSTAGGGLGARCSRRRIGGFVLRMGRQHRRRFA